jgi:hypothetical protein
MKNASQPYGTMSTVAQGSTSMEQFTASSFTGSDHVVESFGKQVSGRIWGLGVRVTKSENQYYVK